MNSATLFFILGILWWVVGACRVVALLAWIYIQLVYFKWNKEDREQESIVKHVQDAVNEKLDEITVDNGND